MSREYPRHYLIVEEGQIKEVTVKDPVHDAALCFAHQEAVGLNPPQEYDYSQDVIEEPGEG